MNFKLDGARTFASIQLTGKDNYAVWSYTMEEHLITFNLFDFVSPKGKLLSQHLAELKAVKGIEAVEVTEAIQEGPSVTKDPGKVADRSQEAKSILLASMSADEIAKIIHCKTAADIWRHFKDAYGKKSENEELELMMELNSLKCVAAKDVAETVNKALTLKGKLNSLRIEIDGTLMISALIKALPNNFKTFLDLGRCLMLRARPNRASLRSFWSEPSLFHKKRRRP